MASHLRKWMLQLSKHLPDQLPDIGLRGQPDCNRAESRLKKTRPRQRCAEVANERSLANAGRSGDNDDLLLREFPRELERTITGGQRSLEGWMDDADFIHCRSDLERLHAVGEQASLANTALLL